jgi:hypothetical protein
MGIIRQRPSLESRHVQNIRQGVETTFLGEPRHVTAKIANIIGGLIALPDA